MEFVLLFSVAVIATCGLVYELIAGALASYLLGDSITQFSLIIGIYLFSMGIGSWLSKFPKKNLINLFIQVELLIGLIGGCSAAILFMSFNYVESFKIILYSFVVLTGILVGLEIPLLMRILKDRYKFEDLISRVFAIDYIGALIASILFPLVLVPYLGLIRSAFLFGIFNIVVGIWALFIFKEEVPWNKSLRGTALCLLLLLTTGFIYSNKIQRWSETATYPDPIVYSETSKYQRIILTSGGKDLRLFLNGNLQFSSKDEYRYHEALVHPGLASIPQAKRVLILGGGDGLALREVLTYPKVKEVLLVDLDPAMTRLFTKHAELKKLNKNSLTSEKVKVINQDAFVWARDYLKNGGEKFDYIAIDFPDPSNYSLGKLYSTSFFSLAKNLLDKNGVLSIQSTSPYFARKAFWCVGNTLEAVGLKTIPYNAYVPSFGIWGYYLAHHGNFKMTKNFNSKLRYINTKTVDAMLTFPSDMAHVKTDINQLNNQALVRYFENEWSQVN
ncbi:MAG: polyamine aminopropyltransferase [Halobacteriovoraceae bacterium]|jgi:spermidine synthase|nr:polyamine aminopropyltransferase [Halobacteriovoraceae bacterium]MBT5095353.1 polyamine aminopropyltransferase [Halobacteriovoraceae bacterium]